MTKLQNDVWPLVIVGAGGLAREVAALVSDINQAPGTSSFELLGFVSPEVPRHPSRSPWLGKDLEVQASLSPQTRFVVAIGSPFLRKKVAMQWEALGFKPATLIHPSVRLGPGIEIGAGSLLAAGSTLTVDMEIGRHVVINLHCTLGHDSKVCDFVTLSPGVHLSGASGIGSQSEIGTGAVILPGRQLGSRCRLGAGAVLTKHTGDDETWVGVPARPTN
ncbi:MAG: acetyltransferase [Bacteroidota bacterium]